MPLTAVLPSGDALDATADPTGWQYVYANRKAPGPKPACGGCGNTVHAKRSPLGLRYFAHNRTTPTCPSHGETIDHLALKAHIATTARSVGLTVVIEATPAPGDTGGWRADVLVTDPATGRRTAFEAQLAAMTVDEGAARTRRYTNDDVATCWVTTKDAPWMWQLPAVKTTRPGTGPLMVVRGIMTVDPERPTIRLAPPDEAAFGMFERPDGCAPEKPATSFEVTNWVVAQDVPFDVFVEHAATGTACSVQLPYVLLKETLPYGKVGTRKIDTRRPVCWIHQRKLGLLQLDAETRDLASVLQHSTWLDQLRANVADVRTALANHEANTTRPWRVHELTAHLNRQERLIRSGEASGPRAWAVNTVTYGPSPR